MERADVLIKFLVSHELLDAMVIRDSECNLVTVDLGEPGADGFYCPTFTRHPEDNPLDAAKRDNERLRETIAQLGADADQA